MSWESPQPPPVWVKALASEMLPGLTMQPLRLPKLKSSRSLHAPSIVADVSQKLKAAGRPAEEADAAAQVVAAYWETRAQRFEGKKGSAAEMYARETPEIVAGKEKPSKAKKARELELAQAAHNDPLDLAIRGELTAAKADEIAVDSPHSDEWKALANNLHDIERGRDDSLLTVAAELKFLPKTRNWDRMNVRPKGSPPLRF